ncbi:thioesterase family protein [Candidatus Pelagibacter sp. Uisw_094]|jgi:acyl-CoA thioester hydrolase|uniref:thioesterase family protein n=1 Tax=Candidatus Pelagibacter sp. Uisw_094 TaxID=3230980 RepID=UPI0039EC19AC|tara:strand:+ start:8550 stop:9017 length:468 start_codon:yes stop_codon:yes gene_type:complete
MPVLLTTKMIMKEWTDYNNHMNLAYYILVFDMGAEKILSKFQMGEHSAKTLKRSTMVVETSTTYQKEIKEGEEVDICLIHLDHDSKRLHYKLEMYNKTDNILSATTEVLALYINLDKRKVSEFENEKIKIIDNYIKENKSNFNTDGLKLSNKLKK